MSILQCIHATLMVLHCTYLNWFLVIKRVNVLKEWVSNFGMRYYFWHAPAVFVVLWLCPNNVWWGWLGGIFLGLLLFDFGRPSSTDCKLLITLSLHHVGPMIAHFFQPQEERLWNAVFYGWVWIPHMWGYFQELLGKKCTKKNSTKYGSIMRWISVAVTPAIYWFYIQRYPLGWNYQTVAFFCQIIGRNVANNNLANNSWMQFETSGFVFTIAYHTCESWLPFFGINLCFVLLLTCVKLMTPSLPSPAKWIMTDKIRKFIEDFKPSEETSVNPRLAFATNIFKDKKWHKDYPILEAGLAGDFQKVKELVDSGEPIDKQLEQWYFTTAYQWMASLDEVKMSKHLILLGADPYLRSTFGSARDFCHQRDAKTMIEFYKQLDPLALEASPPEKVQKKNILERFTSLFKRKEN